MVSLAIHLSRTILPRLGQDPAKTSGFHGWVRNGAYQPSTGENGELLLNRIVIRDFVPFAAYDFERFALSSRESFSVAQLERESFQLAGWPLLKLYYSAFFGAHAIMRALGSGVVKIDGASARFLTDVRRLYDNQAPRMNAGAYQYRLISEGSAPGQATMELLPAQEGTGVHDGFWKLFSTFLSTTASQAVAVGALNSREFFSMADDVTEVIRSGGSEGGTWLSGLRNEINYQHKYSAWFPIPGRAKLLDVLREATLIDSTRIRLDRSKRTDPIGAFVNTTQFLACVNSELATIIAAKSTLARAFGQKWRRLETKLAGELH